MTDTVVEKNMEDISAQGDRIHIRLFHYNDCYEVVHLPALKAAMDSLALDEKVPGNKNMRLMAGDFLAPSVLSSVDEGACMIDCMNDLGLEFVTFGNHEQDVSLEAFIDRVKESKFTWINSNITNLPAEVPPMPDRMTVTVANGEGHERTLAFVGVLCNDPGMYKPGAFWNAKILPTFDTVMNLHEEIMEQNDTVPKSLNAYSTAAPSGASKTPCEGKGAGRKVDTMIPITHQYMPPDRLLAQLSNGKFPFILGGHDHTPYIEEVNNTAIIKVGMDAVNVSVVDMVWNSRADTAPDVSYQIVAVKNFAPDAVLLEKVQRESKRLLGQLEAAKIMKMPRDLGLLTSKDIRVAQRSMGTFITKNIRDGFMADCFAMASGSIRRGHEYEESHEVFTFRDLISECPFYDNCRVVYMPGQVFSDMVSYSRSAKKLGTGGFMQICDRITYVEGQGVTHIAGEPLIPEKMYRIVSTCAALDGVDDNIPLMDWLRSGNSGVQALPLEGHPDLVLQKTALLRFAARKVVVDFVEAQTAPVEEIPLAQFKEIYPDQPDWFLNNVWQHLDWDNDGKLGLNDLAVILCTVWLAQVKEISKDALAAKLIKAFGEKNGNQVLLDIVSESNEANPENADSPINRNTIAAWYLRVHARLQGTSC